MSEEIVLYSKNDFSFRKLDTNKYSFSFQMENNNIYLDKIIDFHLIKLIYDLNKDVYEKAIIEEMINENEAVIFVVMKHLFEDLGLPQRYIYIHIVKTVENNQIFFRAKSIKNKIPENVPKNAHQLPIQNMEWCIDVITQNKIAVKCKISCEPIITIQHAIEKLIGRIFYKIFTRVKQFIENIVV
jgi:hypothetical protein